MHYASGSCSRDMDLRRFESKSPLDLEEALRLEEGASLPGRAHEGDSSLGHQQNLVEHCEQLRRGLVQNGDDRFAARCSPIETSPIIIIIYIISIVKYNFFSIILHAREFARGPRLKTPCHSYIHPPTLSR